jgi:prevent-host-death family protein
MMAQDPQYMPSTEARTRLGEIIRSALRGKATIVTHYDEPAVVILDFKEYERLMARAEERPSKEAEE